MGEGGEGEGGGRGCMNMTCPRRGLVAEGDRERQETWADMLLWR